MKLDLKQPVSRWELIDAISKLHVIDDGCNPCPKEVRSQMLQILNNPEVLDGTCPIKPGLTFEGEETSAD